MNPVSQDNCQSQISLPDSQVVTSIHVQPPLPEYMWTISRQLECPNQSWHQVYWPLQTPLSLLRQGPNKGNLRTKIVVCKATCLKIGRNKYASNTQQNMKTRMQHHVQDTKNLNSLRQAFRFVYCPLHCSHPRRYAKETYEQVCSSQSYEFIVQQTNLLRQNIWHKSLQAVL